MRKAIKIKASTILLAWFVIFAHSIIPHNHLTDGPEGCQNLIHAIKLENHSSEKTLRIENQPSDAIICHYSGFIFQQFNSDNLIFSPDKAFLIKPVNITRSVQVHTSIPFISDPHLGTSALRAPPLS